jgi:hypothetical protein
MKKAIFGLLYFTYCNLFSQQNTPDVVATSGDYFTNVNGSLSWTLGEIAIETLNEENAILTQGFQQSNFTMVSLREIDNDYEIRLFPNPTRDIVSITFDNFSTQSNMELCLMDLQGKVIWTEKIDTSKNKNFDIAHLAAGIYLVRLTDTSRNIIKTFKINKI